MFKYLFWGFIIASMLGIFDNTDKTREEVQGVASEVRSVGDKIIQTIKDNRSGWASEEQEGPPEG